MRACIGLCTHNGADRLRETLDAIGAMDAAGESLTRLVVVDNASTDRTREVASERAVLGNGLRVEVIGESRPGKTYAMRALFAHTDEPAVLLLDDDCLPGVRWGAALLGCLNERPRAGVVGGPVINEWRDAAGRVCEPTTLAAVYRRSLGDQELGERRKVLEGESAFLMGASLGIRRAALEASGWLGGVMLESRTGDRLECGAEDAEVCIRVRRAGWEIVYEPGAAMRHVIPAERQTGAYLARLRGAICRGEPALQWVAGKVPDIEYARRQVTRAQRLYLKSLLFTWNSRRGIRLAERRGKMQGWEALVGRMGKRDTGVPAADSRR